MRYTPLMVLLVGFLLAGWAILEPEPSRLDRASGDTGWRRTADGWERLPARLQTRGWYVAAFHPALIGLMLGQLAVGCLVALPLSSARRPALQATPATTVGNYRS